MKSLKKQKTISDSFPSRLVEWLKTGDETFLVPGGREGTKSDDWLQSAVEAHKNKPFNAILARDTRTYNDVINWSDELSGYMAKLCSDLTR